MGEFVKVGLVIALMIGVVKTYPALRWLPFLVGLIAALKAAGFALLWVKDGGELSDEALEIRTTKTSTDRYEE